MNLLWIILYYVVQAFIICLWARFIIDLVRAVRQQWRPKGAALVLLSAVYAVTDPPLKLVRRFIKPIRFGAVGLDLSWTIVLVIAIIVSYLLVGLTR